MTEISPEERQRARTILDALEQAFRPVAETLRFDEEPAVTFDAGEDQ